MPLVSLPTEVRNTINRAILDDITACCRIEFEPAEYDTMDLPAYNFASFTSLTLVNRRIHEELTRLFFRAYLPTMVFYFETVQSLYRFAHRCKWNKLRNKPVRFGLRLNTLQKRIVPDMDYEYFILPMLHLFLIHIEGTDHEPTSTRFKAQLQDLSIGYLQGQRRLSSPPGSSWREAFTSSRMPISRVRVLMTGITPKVKALQTLYAKRPDMDIQVTRQKSSLTLSPGSGAVGVVSWMEGSLHDIDWREFKHVYGIPEWSWWASQHRGREASTDLLESSSAQAAILPAFHQGNPETKGSSWGSYQDILAVA